MDCGRVRRNGNAERERTVSRRKFIEVVGASGATASLAGCSGNDSEATDGKNGQTGTTNSGSGRIEVTWSAFGDFSERMPDIRQALWNDGLSEDIYLKHMAHPPGGTDKVRSQFQQWFASNRSEPDIILADDAWIAPFIQRGEVINLNKNMSGEKIKVVDESYSPSILPPVRGADGDYFGIPFMVGIGLIAYRKDLFEDAGYDPDGENWKLNGMSWKRFSQIVSDVQEQSPNIDYGYIFDGQVGEGLSCCHHNEWMTSFGGAYFGGRKYLFGPVGERPITVDEEPHHKSIRMIRTFIHGQEDDHALEGYGGGISPPGVLQWDPSAAVKPFLDDNALAMRHWPATIRQATEKYGDKLGVMPIPSGVPESEAKYPETGGIARHQTGGWDNMINSNSENIDASVKVLEHMIGNTELRLALFGENSAVLPADLSLLGSKELGNLEYMGQHMDLYQLGAKRGLPRPASPVWDRQSPKISQEVHASMSQNKSPEDAMKSLEEKLRQIENSY